MDRFMNGAFLNAKPQRLEIIGFTPHLDPKKFIQPLGDAMNDKTITLNNLEAAACSTRAAKPTISSTRIVEFSHGLSVSIIGHEGHKETLLMK